MAIAALNAPSSKRPPLLSHSHPPPKPDLKAFLATFTTYNPPTIPQLKQIHAHVLRTGFPDRSLLLKLALFSSLDYAISVFFSFSSSFSGFPSHADTLLCNLLVKHLCRAYRHDVALLVYARSRNDGLFPDRLSFPPLIKASSQIPALQEGTELHGLAVRMGLGSNPFIQTSLIGFYRARGLLQDARKVFDRMLQRNVIAWSVMMAAYYGSGLYNDVLQLFEEMKSWELEPDEVILTTVLLSCGRSGNLDCGEAIHSYISEMNLALDSRLQSALIFMYANCGSMDHANQLFEKMEPKSLFASTAMVSGYSKIGKVEDARLIFDQMHEKDLVSWGAMIAGYAKGNHPNEGLKLFKDMQIYGIRPDEITMLRVISACAHLGVLEQAKWIHKFVDSNGFGDNLSVNTALIDMYGKCGSLDRAYQVFDNMHQRDVISWTSMINALAMHGNGAQALLLFEQMKMTSGVEPDWVTFVCLLDACSQAGLVYEGCQIFMSMIKEYNITPNQEHCGFMVDLLGRASLLDEAAKLVEEMPFEPNIVVWESLLTACSIHDTVELGEFSARRLLELDPSHGRAYVLLSNIYAKANRWGDVREVRRLMMDKGITWETGCSWVELNNDIHEFCQGDQKHSRINEINNELNEIVWKLKSISYAPNACSLLDDLEINGIARS